MERQIPHEQRQPLLAEDQDRFANALAVASESLAPLLAEKECELSSEEYATVWAAQQRRALGSRREARVLSRSASHARRKLLGGDNSYMMEHVIPRVESGLATGVDLQLLAWSINPPEEANGIQPRSRLASATDHHLFDLLPAERKIYAMRGVLARYVKSAYQLEYQHVAPQILAIVEADRLEKSSYTSLDPMVDDRARDSELRHLITLVKKATTAHGSAVRVGGDKTFALPEKLRYINDAAENFLRARQAAAVGKYVSDKYEAPWQYTFSEAKSRAKVKREQRIGAEYSPKASNKHYLQQLQTSELLGGKLPKIIESEHPYSKEALGILWAAMVQRALLHPDEGEIEVMRFYRPEVCAKLEQFALGRLHLLGEGKAPLWQVQIALDGLYGPKDYAINTEEYGSIEEDKTAFADALQAWLLKVKIGGKTRFKDVAPRAHSLHLGLTAEVAFLQQLSEEGVRVDELATARIGRILKPKFYKRLNKIPSQLPEIVKTMSGEVRKQLLWRERAQTKLFTLAFPRE